MFFLNPKKINLYLTTIQKKYQIKRLELKSKMNTPPILNANQVDEDFDKNLENDAFLENEDEVKKGHRRSKNDTEGRTYKCKLCGKSYLSYPALYTHSKQKHNTCNTSGRGRGRPKKESNEVSLIYFIIID